MYMKKLPEWVTCPVKLMTEDDLTGVLAHLGVTEFTKKEEPIVLGEGLEQNIYTDPMGNEQWITPLGVPVKWIPHKMQYTHLCTTPAHMRSSLCTEQYLHAHIHPLQAWAGTHSRYRIHGRYPKAREVLKAANVRMDGTKFGAVGMMVGEELTLPEYEGNDVQKLVDIAKSINGWTLWCPVDVQDSAKMEADNILRSCPDEDAAELWELIYEEFPVKAEDIRKGGT
jgi:hypothetical protein